jgi:hypothetical protein
MMFGKSIVAVSFGFIILIKTASTKFRKGILSSENVKIYLKNKIINFLIFKQYIFIKYIWLVYLI